MRLARLASVPAPRGPPGRSSAYAPSLRSHPVAVPFPRASRPASLRSLAGRCRCYPAPGPGAIQSNGKDKGNSRRAPRAHIGIQEGAPPVEPLCAGHQGVTTIQPPDTATGLHLDRPAPGHPRRRAHASVSHFPLFRLFRQTHQPVVLRPSHRTHALHRQAFLLSVLSPCLGSLAPLLSRARLRRASPVCEPSRYRRAAIETKESLSRERTRRMMSRKSRCPPGHRESQREKRAVSINPLDTPNPQ